MSPDLVRRARRLEAGRIRQRVLQRRADAPRRPEPPGPVATRR